MIYAEIQMYNPDCLPEKGYIKLYNSNKEITSVEELYKIGVRYKKYLYITKDGIYHECDEFDKFPWGSEEYKRRSGFWIQTMKKILAHLDFIPVSETFFYKP
jgi:hypothetical protein